MRRRCVAALLTTYMGEGRFSGPGVCPLLLFDTVFGLSVEDLSEGGGPFLGVDRLTYRRPLIVGETVYADSEVVDRRETTSRPGYGIVTWRTHGTTAKGDIVLEYQRANLVRKRKPA